MIHDSTWLHCISYAFDRVFLIVFILSQACGPSWQRVRWTSKAGDSIFDRHATRAEAVTGAVSKSAGEAALCRTPRHLEAISWFFYSPHMFKQNLGVSINGGTPSWMIKGKSHLEMDDNWGYPYFGKPPSIQNSILFSPHLAGNHESKCRQSTGAGLAADRSASALAGPNVQRTGRCLRRKIPTIIDLYIYIYMYIYIHI